MFSVHEIAREIVAREGGFVNDPDDLGGATKYGVTIHTMRKLGLDKDLDGDIDVDDVKLLRRKDAEHIFTKHYFEKPRINLLPQSLQATVFDMYVNAGGNAIKILQRLLSEFQEPVTVDGALGPKTAAAVHRVFEKAGDYIVDAYGIARRNYYFRIADTRPKNRKYARTRAGGKGGWIKRAEEFISPRYHLSDEEFKKRVRTWA